MDATPTSSMVESGSRETPPEADAARPRHRVGSLLTVRDITEAMKGMARMMRLFNKATSV